jgi:hypothetical protein
MGARNIDVAVLGCGPAGLMAAEGAAAAADRKNRVRVSVYSIRRKSDIHGAQYLHERIYPLTYNAPHEQILYYKIGTSEGYAEKVYGDRRAAVSWNHFEQGLHAGWEMQSVYNRLWDRWEKRIIPANFSIHTVPLHEWAHAHGANVVISTVPLPQICKNPAHSFPTRDIWITSKSSIVDGEPCPENCVVYNGQPGDSWYRTSNLFGHESTEYSKPVDGSVRGVKVVGSNCDCVENFEQQSDGKALVTAGRWGKWQRGVLVHHAYHSGKNAVERWMDRSI